MTGVSLVRGRRARAIVVDLRNRSDRTLTDLPVDVGVRAPGGRHALNARATSTGSGPTCPRSRPAVRPVGVQARRGRAPRQAVRTVGVRPRDLSRASSLPRLVATASRVAPAAARVENPSEIPQYGLQVYASARRGPLPRRGQAGVDHLGPARRGRPHPADRAASRGALRVFAVPTIFE